MCLCGKTNLNYGITCESYEQINICIKNIILINGAIEILKFINNTNQATTNILNSISLKVDNFLNLLSHINKGLKFGLTIKEIKNTWNNNITITKVRAIGPLGYFEERNLPPRKFFNQKPETIRLISSQAKLGKIILY